MRHLKFLFVAFAITMSTVVNADEKLNLVDTTSISSEVKKLLAESEQRTDNDFAVTIFFSISEDQKIQNIKVASPNREINQFLEKKLANQELSGEFWRKGMIYELTIVQKKN